MKTRDYAFFIITYYIVWFASILLAARNYVWLGFAIAVAITALQILWQWYFHSIKYLWTIILMLTFAGFLIDSSFALSHFIEFKANPWSLAAPWIIGLWLNFSVVYYACLSSWFNRYLMLSILAFIGFPLAYVAGVKLGAAQFAYGDWSSLAVGLLWAIGLPIINYIYLNIVVGE